MYAAFAPILGYVLGLLAKTVVAAEYLPAFYGVIWFVPVLVGATIEREDFDSSDGLICGSLLLSGFIVGSL